MEIDTTETEALNIKGRDQLNLIIDAKFLTLTGPWHFEDEELSSAKVDLNKIQADFNYLINVMGCNNLMHPDDYNYSKDLLQKLESGKSVDYHFRVITPQAEIKQIHGYGCLLSRESLQARIADWDETTSTLELHLKVFKYAEEVADTCSWTWNVETNTIHCSDNCYRLLGLQPQSTPPHLSNFSQYVHPDDLPKMKEAVSITLETLKPVSLEFRMIRTDKALRYFKAKGEIFKTRKDERYFIGSAQDITEQKLSEQILLERESLLGGVLNAPNVNLCIGKAIRNSKDEIIDYKIILVSKTFEEFNERQDLAGKQMFEQFPETSLEDRDRWRQVVETGISKTHEVVCERKGKLFWFSISCSKFGDGFISVWKDITKKKKTSLELKNNKDLLQSVFDSSLHGIIVYKAMCNEHGELVDLEFQVLNNRAKQMLGKELTGKRYMELSSDIKAPDFWPLNKKVFETGVAIDTESCFEDEGVSKWYRLTIVKLDDGTVTCFDDITERKKAAIEIEHQKEYLQKILDAIPQMVWVYDVKTKEYFFNDRWYSYTGLMPEKCHQFDHLKSDIFHPSQKPEIINKWQQYIQAGNPYSGEALIKNTEGEFRWHLDLSIPIRNASYEIEFWVGTFTDVHEQFLAEKKLKENNALLEAIFNSSINGIQVLDAIHKEDTGEVIDFKWKYSNSVTRQIWRTNDLIGKRLSKEYPIVFKNGMFDKMREVMHTGKSVQFEQRYNYTRDSYRWFDISIVKLEDGVVLTFQDITDRKNAEIELQKSKHFILQITNSTPDIIYVMDVITQSVIYVSSKVQMVFGQKEESVYSQASTIFTKVLHPDDFGRRMHQLQDLSTINENETREIEVRLKVADGSYQWFKIRDTLFKRKANGKVWLTIGLVQNVNDKKIAEGEIFIQQQIDKQSEKLANIGNWQWNLRTGHVTWADNLYQLLECEPTLSPSFELFIESIHPDDRNIIYNESERITKLPDGPLAFYDFRVIKKDGGIKYLRSVSELVTKDGERYAIGAVRDVTYDVLLQQALAERIDFIEALIESSIDRILVIDKDYNVITWNKSCEEVYKLKKEDVIGKHMFRVFPEIDKNTALIEKFREAFKGNTIHLNNVSGIYYDGYYEAFLIPLKNQANEVYCILTILHDITEHVNIQHEMQKLNDTLRQRNLELKSLNDELSTLAFIASHDLREPLRKIQVFSQALVEIEKDNLSSRGTEYFKRMMSAVERMNNLIDSILAFSRTTASNKQIEPVDLTEIVKHVLQELEEVIIKKGVLFECDVLPVFKGNMLQLTQLFHNLITNAIKFQPQDVTPFVKISCQFLYGDAINEPYAIREKQYLQLEVKDNGIGFDEKYVGKIFQIFQRLHTLSEFPGTGMGLAICKKIVENHEGFMVAKSNPGEGATFICYFPVERSILK